MAYLPLELPGSVTVFHYQLLRTCSAAEGVDSYYHREYSVLNSMVYIHNPPPKVCVPEHTGIQVLAKQLRTNGRHFGIVMGACGSDSHCAR